jgi:lactam utilization protein B
LNLIEAKVNSLEALRRSDPRQAALDMVKAHEELARALKDDRRQTQAVVTSVRAFVDKAKAVREAFAG